MSGISETRKVKILDGGFSTQLSLHVGDKVDGDPLWTARFLVTNRPAVLATHLDFLRAGADIIETNTYQASIDGFNKYLQLSKDQSLELIRDAVQIAKEAMKIYSTECPGAERSIAGSVGPYGAALHNASEYSGTYDPSVTAEVIKTWHRPRIEALIEGGVDILALETIPNELEAKALIDLLHEYPGVKAWMTFSCRQDGKSLADGGNFQRVATECYGEALPGQLLGIGVNCLAPNCVSPLLGGINKNRGNNPIPLVVYPNSGEQYSVSEGWVKTDKCALLDDFVEEWLDMGVRYIGGCCRTYAKNLIKIREAVNRWESKSSNIGP